jgi:hypothetical protein
MAKTVLWVRKDIGIRKQGEQLGVDTFAPNEEWPFEGWRNIVCQVRGLLAIEVAPYWSAGDLQMTWDADDPQLDAALFALAVAWQLVDMPGGYP